MFHSILWQFLRNFDKFRDIAPLIQSRYGIRLGSSALLTFFSAGYPIFTPVSVATLADLLRHISQPAINVYFDYFDRMGPQRLPWKHLILL